MQNNERQDIYTRITGKIVAALEQGVRPWIRPWNADNAAGRITRPLRHNGVPYSGINILMLWASSVEQGFGSPLWMTSELKCGLDITMLCTWATAARMCMSCCTSIGWMD